MQLAHAVELHESQSKVSKLQSSVFIKGDLKLQYAFYILEK